MQDFMTITEDSQRALEVAERVALQAAAVRTIREARNKLPPYKS